MAGSQRTWTTQTHSSRKSLQALPSKSLHGDLWPSYGLSAFRRTQPVFPLCRPPPYLEAAAGPLPLGNLARLSKSSLEQKLRAKFSGKRLGINKHPLFRKKKKITRLIALPWTASALGPKPSSEPLSPMFFEFLTVCH